MRSYTSSASPPPTVPLVDLPAAYSEQQEEIEAALLGAARRGRYVLGPETDAFEREFAAHLGAHRAVGVASGTDAVEIALRAAGIGAGDLVFTVAHTAVATIGAVERCGAVPVLVDIDPMSFTMDPARLAEAIQGHRRELDRGSGAVVPVHLFGHPAAMTEITAMAHRAGLAVVEDCAQAHGATLHDRPVGTWSSLAAFSFYPTKNLGAMGDGGAVACGSDELAERARALREYGWKTQRFISEEAGLNSRLDELQSAVLRVRLRRLDADNARRRALAARYDEQLTGTAVDSPKTAPGARHAFHLYVIRCGDRDGLRASLQRAGIDTGIHYPVPVHEQPAYRGRMRVAGPLVQTERAAREILSLPMYPQLSTEQQDRVCAAVRAWSNQAGTPGGG